MEAESKRVDAVELPAGWEYSRLNEIAQINPPLDRALPDESDAVTFVPMRAVEVEGGGLLRPEIRTYGEVRKGYTAFRSGDVIMAKITPCMENGKTTVVPEVPNSVCFGSTEFHVIRPENGVQARWIAQFLLQHDVRRAAQHRMTGGVGQMRVPASFLDELRLPLAPIGEQVRIADTFDELLSDLDAGVESLQRVREKLKLYRASVLKAAVDGTLTKEWRAQHPNPEPAAELLKRILAGRRRRWEEGQLEKFKAKGQEPPRDWKAKYKGPIAADPTKFTALPTGWTWAAVDQLGEVGTGATPNRGMKARYYEAGTVPWVTSSCVNSAFVTDASELVTRQALEECNLTLYPPGTLLLAMYGEGKTRGMCTELKIASTTNQALAAIQSYGETKGYVKLFFAKNYQDVRRSASGGVQPNMNLGLVREIAVPLPPLAEQIAIVETVEDQLSLIEHLEADLEAKLSVAQGLRHATLRHAFSGKLVRQDPNDEPASELLKRIAAVREARARETPTKKRPRTRKAKRI